MANFTGTTTVLSLQVAPSIVSTRLNDIASTFTNFRFTALRLRYASQGLRGSANDTLGDLAACYYGSTPSTAPTTLSGVIEAPVSTIAFSGQTVPVVLPVPRPYLYINAQRWWRTTGSEDIYQGVFYFARSLTASTATVNLYLEYDVEFAGPTYSASSAINVHPTSDETKEDMDVPDIDDRSNHGDSLHPSAMKWFGPDRGLVSVSKPSSVGLKHGSRHNASG